MTISIGAITVRPVHALFGAELRGVDFASPMSDPVISDIRRLADDYAILVFKNDRVVSDEEQLGFCRQLGPGITLGTSRAPSPDARLLPGVTGVGNIGDDNEILPLGSRRLAFKRGNELWHTDESFSVDRGAYSILKAVEIPPDGAAPTEFADMRAVLDDLPRQLLERLEQLTAEHSIAYSRYLVGYDADDSERDRRPPAVQRLINTNPRSGRRSLYLAKHIERIVGLGPEESADLLEQLFEVATQPKYVHRHTWSVGDIVLWDNLATMHRATPFVSDTLRRDMRRTTSLEMAGTY